MSQLRGKCPGCPNEFVYEEGTTSVYCDFCQEWKPVATLKPIGGAQKAENAHTGAIPAAAMQGFDNPESGIVFMANYFDTMDWSDYKESPKIEIAALQECLENNKIKNGAIGSTWYMEFKGVAVPLSKKIEGMQEKAKEMAEKYDPEDSTEAYEAFNTYRKVAASIVANKERLITKMEKAIAYAETYKLDAAYLSAIKAEFASVKASVEGVVEVENINDIPSFVKAKAAIDEAKAVEFEAKGVNAKDEYENGLVQYNSTNPNKSGALAKLEKIRGYSDSAEYINKINKYYSLNELRYFFGKYYVYKLESTGATFNVGKAGCFGKNKKQPENPEEEVKAWSLYEVVNGVPEEKPVIKGIDSLIGSQNGEVACYNNKIFYIKGISTLRGLYSYDVYTGEEKLLDAGKETDYCRNKNGELECAFSENKRYFVLKRKLRDEAKTGCTGKRKSKKTEEIRLNNYSLLLIDMFSNEAKTIAEELVDIIGKYGNKVFYSYAHREINTKVKKKGCSKVKEKEVKYLKDLMLVDLTGGAPKQVLSQACEIKEVYNDKVVYLKWKPNQYNKDLYTYDLKTGAETLIEDNVYQYFMVIKGRIYYTVGNKDFCTLLSQNFEGSDRKEVMREVSDVNIKYERAGWLYILVGSRRGKNRLLVKVHSEDTEKRYPICPQYLQILEISSTHIYYQDTSYNLRVVCSDGSDNKILAECVSDIVVGDDCLYYVRKEEVEAAGGGLFGGGATEALSLYKMDKEGHNIRKLVFNVDKAINYDEKALYYAKAEELRFKVTMPTVNKETGEKDWHYEYHSVQRYFRFDKVTEKSTLVLTTGLPSAKMKSEKKGCFGKKQIEEDIIYEADPEIREYEPQGLAPMGITDIGYEVEAAAAPAQGIVQNLPAGCTGKKPNAQAPTTEPAKNNNGCGCTGKKK